jgi:hypothetical protein
LHIQQKINCGYRTHKQQHTNLPFARKLPLIMTFLVADSGINDFPFVYKFKNTGFQICRSLHLCHVMGAVNQFYGFHVAERSCIMRCVVQGGSNMTGTNCDLFTHNQSRSYLNHLVKFVCNIILNTLLHNVGHRNQLCFN